MNRQLKKNSEILVSVVVPLSGCINQDLNAYISSIHDQLENRYHNYEIILIDPLLRGKAAGFEQLLKDVSNIRYYAISDFASIEVCITAGLDNAIGDYTIILNPNEDPPELIEEFLVAVQGTDGIVVGLARQINQGSAGYRFFRKIYFWLTGLFIKERHPANSTYLIALSRVALNSLLAIKYKNRFIRVLTSSIGIPVKYIQYDQLPTAAESEKSILQSLVKSIDIIVGNSTSPLKFATYLGLCAAFLNLMYIGYIFVVNLVKEQVAEGWTTNSFQNSLMFFCLFLIMTIMSEYLSRLFEESKDRPLYTILSEQCSSIKSSNEEFINVVSNS